MDIQNNSKLNKRKQLATILIASIGLNVDASLKLANTQTHNKVTKNCKNIKIANFKGREASCSKGGSCSSKCGHAILEV